MLEKSDFAQRLKRNYHMRKDSWKGTWETFKSRGLSQAVRKKLDDMGEADRALLGRR